jgi:hypothetical protein
MTTYAVFGRGSSYAAIVVCWIALMCSSITPAAAKPYDRMVGCWDGVAEVYDQQGLPMGGVQKSTGSVYWKTPGTLMHFRQDQAGSTLEYDLDVNGKTATFRSTEKDVTGTEVRPGHYFFLLNFKDGPRAGNWYNNHYFTGQKRRMVLGSFEPAGHAGEVGAIAVQTLTRVSCPSEKQKKRQRKQN